MRRSAMVTSRIWFTAAQKAELWERWKNGQSAAAISRALGPKPCRVALHRALRWRVAQKLALQWSPEQISGWLKQEFPTHQDMQISHEAIYRSLFIQTRGVLKKELTAQLRTERRMRRP